MVGILIDGVCRWRTPPKEVPVGYDDHALGKALYAGVR
jgi:hypothetical protein